MKGQDEDWEDHEYYNELYDSICVLTQGLSHAARRSFRPPLTQSNQILWRSTKDGPALIFARQALSLKIHGKGG